MSWGKTNNLVKKYKTVGDYTSREAMTMTANMINHGMEINIIIDEAGGRIKVSYDDEKIARIYFKGIDDTWLSDMEELGVEISWNNDEYPYEREDIMLHEVANISHQEQISFCRQ